MLKVFVVGLEGRMGQALVELSSDYDCQIVAGLDKVPSSGKITTYTDFKDHQEHYELIIDVSAPSLQAELLDLALEKKLPLVSATTGLSASQEDALKAASQEIPIFRSANYSVGIYVLERLLELATSLLEPDFDIEILEIHHRDKVDAPSGTAFQLARRIQEASKLKRDLVLDRSDLRAPREPHSIGLQALRAGKIPGTHEVLYASDHELISIKHEAQDRLVFAEGMLKAAKFLAQQEAGFYQMSELLKL